MVSGQVTFIVVTGDGTVRKHYVFFERLGMIESFRRLWVCCKSSFYCDLELGHTTLFTYRLLTGTIKNTFFSVLGTIHDRVLYFPKTNCGWPSQTPENWWFVRGTLSSVSEPTIRFVLKPNRRQKRRDLMLPLFLFLEDVLWSLISLGIL